ncbi:BTAD domain-containing putative transcriptional regulator [Plantactinospora sonchi]|uniref:BTAD domain-containing putative transcriptional regulator n=1 Tax=Plantactinospora sonchi TaxID=1544735 RepID=A0ABU7S2S0_9ACTN
MTTGGGWTPDVGVGPGPVVPGRPRLLRRLDQLARRRLVTVIAPAGAGKTTLLREWATRGRAAWHTLVPADRDPQVLLTALVAALRAVVTTTPSTSTGPAGAATPAPATAGGPAPAVPGGAATPAELADRLLDMLPSPTATATSSATATDPVRLVLDDLQVLGTGPAAELLGVLATWLPEGFVLVLAGREAAPFPLGALRSAGRLGEMGPTDLALTPAETRRALTAMRAGADPVVGRIAVECGGWPGLVAAAARLAVSPAPGSRRMPTPVVDRHQLGGSLPGLDPEDLAALTERDLLALWTLVAVRRTGPDLDGRLAPVREWALRRLTEHRRSDDTGPARPGSGEAALRATRILSAGPSGVPEVDVTLADSAVRDDRPDEALRYLTAVPDHTRLPAALTWRLGGVLHRRGDFDAAEALFERAVTEPDPADPGTPPPALSDRAQVLAGWAAARWARGDRTRTRQLADEAVRVAEQSRDDGAVAAAYVAQALVAFSEGDRAGNEHAYARALAAAERAGDVVQQLRIRANVGSRLVEEGRYRAATEELGSAIPLAERAGERLLLALALHNRAEAWLGLGELGPARADADQALTLWQRDGSPLAAFGLLLTARVHRVCGSTSRAVAAYQAAWSMAEPDGNAQVLVEACAGLARTRYADDPAAAAGYARQALTMPSAGGPIVAELAAGWVALCAGDPTTALGHGARARAEAGRRRDSAGLAEAIELVTLATRGSGVDGGTEPGVGRAGGSGRTPVGLVEAAAIWADVGDQVGLATNALLRARVTGDRLAEDVAADRLHRLGVREGAWHVAGPLAAIGPTPVAEVAVQTLGHFAVRLAGVPVPAAAWQSRKARELVKVLAGQLGRPLARETLAAVLWPEVPPEVALRRLSVLISTVRGVLDPDRRHPADRYLATDPATVRINPGHVVLDTVRFHDAARGAIAADSTGPPGTRTTVVGAERAGDREPPGGAEILARLEAVVALYTGDFCDDGEVTGDWVERPRNALAELHLEAIRRLARRCLGTGRPEAAVGWYLRLTAEDGYDESAHLGLVSALSAAGRHGEANRRYREYLGRMREIEVEPAAFPGGMAAVTDHLNDS